VLAINEFTGIDTRSAVGSVDHPLVNAPDPPSIAELCALFLTEGVKLSVAACRKAIDEWGGDVSDITHMVSTTCTNSANPGFDHFVSRELDLNTSTEKVLLHGIGCSGGLAALRTAANLALGAAFLGKPARILVLACELSSTMVRSELDSISKTQQVRIGVTLFSDCASAIVLSNGIGEQLSVEPMYELLGWDHRVLPDTDKDLGFDVHPQGKLTPSAHTPLPSVWKLPCLVINDAYL
jgi:type III polyketide synthase